ncbi:unnamed protein product [Ilex paraguariensis]|uniref:Uncharacterized protein n=1 Tax=Ilex paraguariensis TaxID=185542 RepID=A0ABC8TNY0_9AQUA
MLSKKKNENKGEKASIRYTKFLRDTPSSWYQSPISLYSPLSVDKYKAKFSTMTVGAHSGNQLGIRGKIIPTPIGSRGLAQGISSMKFHKRGIFMVHVSPQCKKAQQNPLTIR